MKYILTLFCLVSFVAYGQEPAYTPMRLNYQFRGIKVDSLFLIPSFNDTTAANNSTMKNVAGALIRTGNDFWMRNSTLNAWLQNVNVGEGSSTSNKFVDSVWRVAGKDSIFWRKGGTTNKIKDSTGLSDSPDRIDGTATNNVNAEMGLWQMRFNGSNAATSSFVLDSMATVSLRSDSIVLDGYNTATADVIFRDLKSISTNTVNTIDLSANATVAIGSGDSARFSASNKIQILKGVINHVTEGNKYEFKDFNNTFLRIDTLGNFEAGDLTKDSLTFSLLRSGNEIIMKSKATPIWKEQNFGTNTYLKVGRGVNSISLASTGYSSRVPGVYVISTGGANTFELPDADDWAGQSVTVINTDGGNTGGISASVGTIYDRGTGSNINSIAAQEMIIFYSDGSNWYGAIQ